MPRIFYASLIIQESHIPELRQKIVLSNALFGRTLRLVWINTSIVRLILVLTSFRLLNWKSTQALECTLSFASAELGWSQVAIRMWLAVWLVTEATSRPSVNCCSIEPFVNIHCRCSIESIDTRCRCSLPATRKPRDLKTITQTAILSESFTRVASQTRGRWLELSPADFICGALSLNVVLYVEFMYRL